MNSHLHPLFASALNAVANAQRDARDTSKLPSCDPTCGENQCDACPLPHAFPVIVILEGVSAGLVGELLHTGELKLANRSLIPPPQKLRKYRGATPEEVATFYADRALVDAELSAYYDRADKAGRNTGD